MDLVTRNAGTFLFLGGILVLIGYYVQYNVIREAHQKFLNDSITFYIWLIFAVSSALSYLLLFTLWISTDALESASGIFLVGLATFIFGAILWPWVFKDKYAEASAIWLTAIGSIGILIATTMSMDAVTMALPFASILVFQHVLVDGIWWLSSDYRAGQIDETKKIKHVVKALYQAYYAPLFIAILLLLVDTWYRQTAVIIVISVTSMHFVVGGIVALNNPSFINVITTRCTNATTAFADVNIIFALVLAVYLLLGQLDCHGCDNVKNERLVFPAILAAVVGNTFCLADQLNVKVTLRSGWVGILILWGWLAILDEAWGYAISTIVSGLIFLVALSFLFTRYNGKTLLSSHLVAGVFHAVSSVALSAVVWVEDKSWRSPMTRYVTSWDHANNTVNVTEVDCSEKPCYMRIDIKVLDEKLPLVDFVVAASCISASYHLLIVYKLVSGSDNGVFALRWKDYSLSASLLLVVISALCGVSDVFLLVVPAVVVYILLDETPRLEEDWKTDARPRARFASYIVLYLLAWTPTVYQFYTSWEDDPKPPDAIVAIIFTLFAVYSGFIINFVEENNKAQERRYIFLSFLAKTTLHWLLYTGISGRKDRVYATEEEAQTADTSENDGTWWELVLSIGVPVIVGSFGYYFTKEKNETLKNEQKSVPAVNKVRYTSLQNDYF